MIFFSLNLGLFLFIGHIKNPIKSNSTVTILTMGGCQNERIQNTNKRKFIKSLPAKKFSNNLFACEFKVSVVCVYKRFNNNNNLTFSIFSFMLLCSERTLRDYWKSILSVVVSYSARVWEVFSCVKELLWR